MNKFLRFLFVALMGLMGMNNAFADDKIDELTWEGLELSPTATSYAPFADKSFNSSAVYAGVATSGAGKYIQLRSNKNDAGIVTTKSGGKLKSVTVAFNSSTTDRALDIYGKNEPYESGPDMYDANKKGELIGSIAANGESLTITPDVSYKYVGMVAHNGAIYIDKITVVWEEAQGDTKTETSIEFTGDYLTRFTTGKDGDETPLPTATVHAGLTTVYVGEAKWSLKMGANWVIGEEEPSIGNGKVYIPEHSYGDLVLTAKYDGDDNYEACSKSYTLKVYKGYVNIQDILEQFPEVGGDSWKTKEEVWNKGYQASYWQADMPVGGEPRSKEALVTYVNGSYTYIKDDFGSLLLYGSGLGFKQGDKISGDFGHGMGYGAIYGTLKAYNGLLELAVNKEDVEFVVKSSDNPVEPKTIVLKELNQSNMNEYLKIENAEFVEANGKNLTFKVGDETLAVYNQWNVKIEDDDKNSLLKVGTKYDLTGMGSVYWKNETLANQLYLISFDERGNGQGVKNFKMTINHDGEVFTESFPATDWENIVIDGTTTSIKIMKVEVGVSKPMKYVGFIGTMFNTEDGWQHDETAWRTVDLQKQEDGTWALDLGEGQELVENEWLNKNKTKTFEFFIYAEDESGTPIHYNNGGNNYRVTFSTGGDDDPNAISNVKAENSQFSTYNLSGQPVTRTYRGVTIQNARKVLRK